MLSTLGQRALILRKDLGYSQRDVVDYLKSYGVEIDYSHYSRLENDKAQPSIPVLVGMAKVLNCTSDYLLLLSDDAKPRAPGQATKRATDNYRRHHSEGVETILDRTQPSRFE